MAMDSSQNRDGAQPTASEEIEATLNDLEQRVDRLKILYEQYFMGIEKLEPQVPRKEVTRIIINLAKIQIRNTGLRFRYRTIVQRWNVYITRWNRILREIENGTYERDVLRAQRNMAKRGEEFPAAELGVKLKRRRGGAPEEPAGAPAPGATPPPEPAAGAMPPDPADLPATPDELVMEADEPPPPPARPPTPPAGLAAARPPTPPGGLRPAARTPSGVAPAPAGPPLAGGMTLDQVQALFRRLVHAKKLCGEPTDGMKLESLVATINRQAPKIMADHGCTGVEFTVAIKGDKPILKAVPKK
jgi:hypothetical protein